MGAMDEIDAQVAMVAALSEPIRRALYRYVVSQPEPVSRERAAAGVGVAHHIAKFHLDKLVDEGLLEAEYRRPPGRGGPGAGRPAKLYRRASGDIAVSLPQRRYDLAGRVLAEAITTATESGLPRADALSMAARAAGRQLAERATQQTDPLRTVSEVLADNGYEPRLTTERVTLANCPFHNLAQSYPGLICGMNLELIGGLLDALPAGDLHAQLTPAPGGCCVTISTTSN
jgi:predicted ArsR family transcriptional regulator